MTPVPYRTAPLRHLDGPQGPIASFVESGQGNLDAATVEAFGDEWLRYDEYGEAQLRATAALYFDVVTPDMLGESCRAIDVGCGSGRWDLGVAPRVGFLEAVDPGPAALVAARTLAGLPNVRVTQAGFGSLPFAPGSFDFAFSLGVVHHVPDTQAALAELAALVRPGGHVLVYLYYDLDGRGRAYRFLFGLSDAVRRVVSRLPRRARVAAADLLAVTAYLPLVSLARAARTLSPPSSDAWRRLPLSAYVDRSWSIVRTDALDRFGTPLEKRFRRQDVALMLERCGLVDLHFSEGPPYWHVVGRKA